MRRVTIIRPTDLEEFFSQRKKVINNGTYTFYVLLLILNLIAFIVFFLMYD